MPAAARIYRVATPPDAPSYHFTISARSAASIKVMFAGRHCARQSGLKVDFACVQRDLLLVSNLTPLGAVIMPGQAGACAWHMMQR